MQGKQNYEERKIVRNKIRELNYESIYGPAYKPAMSTVRKDYSAFKDYIYNARQAARTRESISARFVRVDNQKEFKLSSWLELEINAKIINDQVVADKNQIRTVKELGFDVKDIEIKTIDVEGKQVKFIINDGKAYFKGNNGKEIIVNGDPALPYDVRFHKPDIVEYKGNRLNVKNGKVSIEDLGDEKCYDIYLDFIDYKLIPQNSNVSYNTVLIELEDDASLEVSVYDTYFGEDVTSVYIDNRNNQFSIKRKFKEYGQLELRLKKDQIVPESGIVKISTDTYQLNCQSNAIDVLINSPSSYHKALLYLSDDKAKAKLTPFNGLRQQNLDFKVLHRTDLKGCKNQRTFVHKALETPDFMILEGPPGSGKTTTILEFIYQELKQGKKIILSASTHVAIDNVLEKILTHDESEELLKYINPVRIGSEDNIYVDEVKKFTYNNIMKNISKDCKRLVEESFNLVCGTTIGILQYPGFKKLGNSPIIEPEFDYLIIDEASKTTFNEFLVPAIFAKKWVIVGDVKQLAPYVEKNDLVPTLVNSKSLRQKSVRDAIYFLIMKSQMGKKEIKNKAFLMSGSTIQYLDKHILDDSFIAVTSLKTENMFTISNNDMKNETYKVSALDSRDCTILIDDSLAKRTIALLNPSTIVVGKKDNIAMDIHFDDFSILHHRIKDFYKTTHDLDDRYSKKLEDEILWRLIRIYELAHSDTNVTKKYEEYIEGVKQYLSKDAIADYDKTIAMISEIALPSIITLLQQGIKKRSRNSKETILNSGFSDKDKSLRFESLEYQYRMHPEISDVPRRLVYNELALKDDTRTYKPFEFFDNQRYEIMDVSGAIVSRNQNEKEAARIMKEIDKISKYAKSKGLKYEIAILSFYNGQVTNIRKKLKKYFKSPKANYNFSDGYIKVSLNTVDKFQGQEAEIVFLSMVQNSRVGFMDSINRVNVAVTRAKEKLILVGDKEFFATKQKDSTLLKELFGGGVRK